MGGSDENSNLVALTPEEHFTVHVLLVKMYPKQSGLILAVNKMCRGHRGKRRNKMYGWLKRRFSEEMKRSQSGSGNSQHGLMWVCNIETKQNKKIPRDSVLEEGWVKGRNKWNVRVNGRCRVCSIETMSPDRTLCPDHFLQHNRLSAKRLSLLPRPDMKKAYQGKMYITDGMKDMVVSKTTTIPEGWRRGRSQNKARVVEQEYT